MIKKQAQILRAKQRRHWSWVFIPSESANDNVIKFMAGKGSPERILVVVIKCSSRIPGKIKYTIDLYYWTRRSDWERSYLQLLLKYLGYLVYNGLKNCGKRFAMSPNLIG